MRKLTITTVLLLFVAFSFGQLTGIKTIPGDYPTIADAVVDLNNQGVGPGGVVFNVAAGYTETITSRINLTATGTSNSPIVFQKDGSGPNPRITAYTGTATPSSSTPDGIWAIVGSDYVTIDGIDLYDPNTTNPATMEYGYGIFKENATNGAQYNTIKNCNIILNRANNASGSGPMVEGSVGILIINSTPTAATTALTITTPSGANSYNKIYSNTIENCNYGIVLNGFAASSPFTNGDFGNDIGGNSLATGNTILNFGGATGATNPSAGIRANNQWGINISYNTINNNDGNGVNHPSTLRGIFAQAGTSANANINYNIITLQSGATTSACTAIDNGIGSTAASNTINIIGNKIKIGYPTATTGVYTAINNSATATTVNINENEITQITGVNLAGTGTHVIIETGSPTNANVLNNTISNIERNGASGSWRIIKTTSPTNLVVDGNLIENIGWTSPASTGDIDAIYSFSSAVNVTVSNNTISNLYTPTTGTINGIREWGVSGNKTIINNQIYNFTTTIGGAGGAKFNGIFCSIGNIEIAKNKIYNLNSEGTTGGTGGTVSGVNISGGTNVFVHRNEIYNLSSLSSNPIISGILASAGSNVFIYNNFISDLKATNANAANPIIGINITSTSATAVFGIYFNTVYLQATSSGLNFGSSAIFASTSPTVALRNNIFVNNSVPNGTGYAVVYRRSSTSLTSYHSSSNNNCFFVNNISGNQYIYFDGTNSDQTFADYQSRVSPRDNASINIMPPFVNVSTTPYDLHIQQNIITPLESAATSIQGISEDIDGEIRWGNAGYTGIGYAPDIGADEFEGAPNCTTPNPGNTISSSTSICVGESITLTLQNTPQEVGLLYQWQSSTDGLNFVNISGANSTTYNTVPSEETYYRCMVTCLNGPETAYSNPVQITFTHKIISTVPGGRCGAGTVVLEATATPGSNIAWYDAPTGGNLLGTGSPFTTPVIANTTTFYVEAYVTTTSTFQIGNQNNISNTSAQTPFSTLWHDARNQYLFLASELQAAGLLAGNITELAVNVASVGSPAMSNFTISIGNTNLNAFSTPAYETGLTTVFTSPSFTFTNTGWQTITFDTPFYWDGNSNIIIQFCYDNSSFSTNTNIEYSNTPFNSHIYGYQDNASGCSMTSPTHFGVNTARLNVKFKLQGICSGLREPVVATIGFSNPIAITSDTTVCYNGVVKLEVLSGLTDYDQFTWFPVTNLYTDAACTIPYVDGSSATEVYYKSVVPGAHTITCQAYNTVTECGAIDNVEITVLNNTASLTATVTEICNAGSTTLNVTSQYPFGTATFQFAVSTDGINYTNIPGATGTTYTSPLLTEETYYQWTAMVGTEICIQEQITINVNSPSIAQITPASICGSGSVTLEATPDAGSTIMWYDQAFGGQPIAFGNTFITPVLTSTTSYYAEPYISTLTFNVGKQDDPSAALSSLGNYGMYFATTNEVIINSVDIYPSTAGTLKISLINDLLQTVDQKTFTITSADISTTTKKTLNLDFYVPNNVSGWRLVYDLAIYRGAGSYSYPYSANGFTITGNTYDGNNINGGTRMYFYNWQVTNICRGTREEVIATVTQAPSVSISSTDNNICAGTSVTLTANSSNPDYEYTWNNGMTGQSINVSPTTTTTYIVTANDSQTGCVTTDQIVIDVKPLPVATATVDNSNITCGQTIQLTAGSLYTPIEFVENFNGSTHVFTAVNTSTGGNNPAAAAWTLRPNGYVYSSVTFNSPDNSQFIMSNSDAQGSGGTTHTELISPTFSSVGFDSITIQFAHFYRHFTGSSAKVEIFDGSQWTTLQTWTTTQGASNNFSNVTIPVPNTFLNNPNLKIRFVYDASFGYYWAIDNAKVNLFKINTFNWSSTPAYFSSIIHNPTDAPTTTTQYTVTVTSVFGCSNTASVTVNVNNAPAPLVTVQNTCGVSNLTATNYSGQLIWSTEENTETITVSDANPVTVYYVSGACTSNVATVNPAPIQIPNQPTVNDINACFGETISPFTATSNYNEFIWFSDAQLTNQIGTGATFQSNETNVGTYTYYVVAVNNGCYSTPEEAILTIYSTPTVTISQNGDTLFSSVPTGNQWYGLNQGLIPGATGNYYVVTTEDTYYVIVVDANGCSAASNTIHVNPTNITQNSSFNFITIIPNPASNYAIVNVGNLQNVKIQLISADGKIISENNVLENSFKLSLKGLSTGVYTVRIITSDKVLNQKLVVE